MRENTWDIGDIVSSTEFVRGRRQGSVVLVGVQGSKLDLDAYDETRMDAKYVVERVEELNAREQLAIHHPRDAAGYIITARRMKNNQYRTNGELIQWATAGDGMNLVPDSKIRNYGKLPSDS